MRHGETVANATGRYNGRTIDAFSDRGRKQVAALTQALTKVRFDVIVVSPSPRALRTIAPYLAAHPGVKAEIWPELYECCDAHSRKIHGLTSAKVRYGGKIAPPADIARYFTLPPGKDKFILAPSYDDGLRQIRMAAARLRAEFPSKVVLVVGHSLHGGRLIELLEGEKMVGKVRPGNGSITRLVSRPGGVYAIAR